MKAKFEVKQTIADWKPPFQKQITTEAYWVGEGDNFDLDGENVSKIKAFKLIKCDSGKVLVEFHREFTLKGHEHPANRQLWVRPNEAATVSAQWHDKGISKTAKLLEISDE